MTAPELIQTIEATGGVLTLNGDRIKYQLPEDAVALVEMLRECRDDVFRFLKERERHCGITDLPRGIRLLAWEPKSLPVAIETWQW